MQRHRRSVETLIQTRDGLTEEACAKKALKAAGVSEEKIKLRISIADIVSGKVSSDDLAKYEFANVLDGLKNSSESGGKCN